MTLSAAQRDTFATDGYLVIPGVVDRPRADAALRAINHWMATGFDRTEMDNYHRWGYAPELTTDPRLVGLFADTAAADLASDLVGAPIAAPDRAQIAIRFPAAAEESAEQPGGHIDGIMPDKLYGFTLLAGVLLSDAPAGGLGNFTVWPGTHHHTAQWFADNGGQVGEMVDAYRELSGLASAHSQPVAVCGQVGDLILAHYLLIHGIGRHVGPSLRYAAFFRLKSTDRESFGDRSYREVWAEWPAMQPRSS
jgi:hypothetical protein